MFRTLIILLLLLLLHPRQTLAKAWIASYKSGYTEQKVFSSQGHKFSSTCLDPSNVDGKYKLQVSLMQKILNYKLETEYGFGRSFSLSFKLLCADIKDNLKIKLEDPYNEFASNLYIKYQKLTPKLDINYSLSAPTPIVKSITISYSPGQYFLFKQGMKCTHSLDQ